MVCNNPFFYQKGADLNQTGVTCMTKRSSSATNLCLILTGGCSIEFQMNYKMLKSDNSHI